jgi:DNA-binding FadR family transcriptional regulator
MNDPLSLRTMPPRRRLADHVAEQIEQAIVEGHLEPGDKLPSQADLCKQLKVSRTVVREAVQMLVSRGLVVAQRGTGTTVLPVSRDIIVSSLSRFLKRRDGKVVFRDLQQVRRILELATARLAARYATETDIAELRQIMRDLEHLSGDVDAFARRDADFHRKLAEATQNPLLVVLVDSIRDLLQDYILSSLPHVEIERDVLPAHRRILECVESGHIAGARQAMWEHITAAPWERDVEDELLDDEVTPMPDRVPSEGQPSADPHT